MNFIFRLLPVLLCSALALSAQTVTIEPTPVMEPQTPVVSGQSNAPLAGTTSIQAAIVQAEETMKQALLNAAPTGGDAPPVTSDSFAYALWSYHQFHSTPYLYIMGFEIGNGDQWGTMRIAIFTLMVLFVAISISSQLKAAASGKPLSEFFGGLFLKLCAAAILLSRPDMVYATAKTVMDTGLSIAHAISTEASKNSDGATARMAAVAKAANIGDIEVASVRTHAIQRGLTDVQGVFTQYVGSPEQDFAAMDYWASYLNALGKAQMAYSTAASYPDLPALAKTNPDDLRPKIIRRYAELSMDSARMDTSAGPSTVTPTVSWTYTSTVSGTAYAANRSPAVESLAVWISRSADAIVAEINKTDMSPSGTEKRDRLMKQYESVVRETTSRWAQSTFVDELVNAMKDKPAWQDTLLNIASWTKRTALATVAAISPQNWMDKVLDWLSAGVTLCQKFLIPLISKIMGIVLNLLMELSLLGLLFATPLWFFDGTKKAFTGALETLFSSALMLPAYQLFQMVLDGVFVLAKGIVGGMAVKTSGGSMLFGGVVAGLTGGALIYMLFMTVAYLIASVILAFKTPSLVSKFLSGGAWVTGLVGAAVTGMIGGGLIALAAATGGAGAAGLLPALGGAGATAGGATALANAGGSMAGGVAAKAATGVATRRVLFGAAKSAGHMAYQLASNRGSGQAAVAGYVGANARKKQAAAANP